MNNLLHKAVLVLAGHCDGAHQRDDSGFNRLDTDFGHKLAQTAFEAWTPGQKRAAWKMVRKYRGQLHSYGIDYDAIPEPPVFSRPLPKQNSDSPPSPKTVTVDKDQILIQFPYDPSLVAAVKEIPGRKWEPERKVWTVPLTPAALAKLKEFVKDYGFDGDVDKVVDLAGKATQIAHAAIEASKASSAEIEVEGLGGTLRPFQKAGVKYAVEKQRVLIGDQPGLGKTMEALATVQALNAYPVLVIVPATLKWNWYNHTRNWLLGKTIQMLGTETAGRADANITIINYDQLKRYREYLVQRDFKAVICDESHYLKSAKAARTQYVEEIVNGCLYGRTQKGRLDRRTKEQLRGSVDVRLLLSGTPSLNRPDELAPQLQILDRLREFGGWYGFMRDFCNLSYGRFGMDTSGAKNLKELNDRLRASCYIRRLKTEVLKELPPKQRTVVPTELTNRAEYDRAERDLIAWLRETAGDKKADAAERAEQLVRIGALKQLAARGKMAAIKEWVADFLDTEQKLVLFAWHQEIVRDLARTFNCDSIYGDGTSASIRQAKADRFQNDPTDKLIALNIESGGLGLDLYAASNVIFCELGWNPGKMDQASDRCVLEGQPVLTTQGWKPVEMITVGDLVISNDGLPHRVVDAWNRLARGSHAHNSKDIAEIEVEGWHETLRFTSDHNVLTSRGWRAAGDLKPRDKIQMPSPTSGSRTSVAMDTQVSPIFAAGNHAIFGDHYETPRFKPVSLQTKPGLVSLPKDMDLTREAAFVFGYYVGDGFASISPDKGRFVSFSGHKDQKASHIAACKQWASAMGVNSSLRDNPNTLGCELRCYSSELALWFTKHFGRILETKALPTWIFETPADLRRAFIQGWLAADGYVRVPTHGGTLRHEIITASKRLTADAVRLLLSVGIKPCVFRNDAANFYSVGWTEGQPTELIVTKVLNRTCNKVERVYDLTIEDSATFVVGTAVVHNCHRIGQTDNVMEWWFIGRKTIDETIQELIEKKRAVVDAATDGKEHIEDVGILNELVARLRGEGTRAEPVMERGDSLELF